MTTINIPEVRTLIREAQRSLHWDWGSRAKTSRYTSDELEALMEVEDSLIQANKRLLEIEKNHKARMRSTVVLD